METRGCTLRSRGVEGERRVHGRVRVPARAQRAADRVVARPAPRVAAVAADNVVAFGDACAGDGALHVGADGERPGAVVDGRRRGAGGGGPTRRPCRRSGSPPLSRRWRGRPHDPAAVVGAGLRRRRAGEPAQVLRRFRERGSVDRRARSAVGPRPLLLEPSTDGAEAFVVDARRFHNVYKMLESGRFAKREGIDDARLYAVIGVAMTRSSTAWKQRFRWKLR